MFNVLKFDTQKNKDEYKKHELKLISFNNSYENKIYLYILLCLLKNKLNNFDKDELNKISKEYKKLINKYVKKIYKLNSLNLNIENNKKINEKHFNILSELLNLNITIFGKKNLLLFKSSTEYKKSIYFLLKRNKLFLIAEKKKNSLSYQFKNKVLSGGVFSGPSPQKKGKGATGSEFIPESYIKPDDDIGLWDPGAVNNWYSIKQVNDFLKNQINKALKAANPFDRIAEIKEIYIATFTNIFRYDIYTMIHNINVGLEEFKYILPSDYHVSDIRLVLSGGDCFNNLLNNKENRPISPDIDCKLNILSGPGKRLQLYKDELYNYPENENREEDAKLFNLILLLVRNKLDELLTEEVQAMNHNKERYSKNFRKIYARLINYCKILFPGDTRIDNLFKYQRYKTDKKKEVGEIKKIVRFEKRFNHMEAGFNEKTPNEPFRLNNVLLYSIDGIFDGKYDSFNGIAGILDIVISLPTHAGYMDSTEYKQIDNEDIFDKGITEIYIMTKDYYINKDNLKMVNYGLRTANKKIIKDFNRIYLLLKEDYTNEIKKKKELVKNIIEKIGRLKSDDNYKICNKQELEDLESKFRIALKIILKRDIQQKQFGGVVCETVDNSHFSSQDNEMYTHVKEDIPEDILKDILEGEDIPEDIPEDILKDILEGEYIPEDIPEHILKNENLLREEEKKITIIEESKLSQELKYQEEDDDDDSLIPIVKKPSPSNNVKTPKDKDTNSFYLYLNMMANKMGGGKVNKHFTKSKKVKQMGGEIDSVTINRNPDIYQTVLSYKIPKALYYLVSNLIISDSKELIKKNLKEINNVIQMRTLGENNNKIFSKVNYEKFTELTQGKANERYTEYNNEGTKKYILTELFNSNAIQRFDNKGNARWSSNRNIIPISEMLNTIIIFLENRNNIRNLYFFDLPKPDPKKPNPIVESGINREVAKCLLHTFLPSFNPKYIYKSIEYTNNLNTPDVYVDVQNIEKLSKVYNNLTPENKKPFVDFYNTIRRISISRIAQ